MLFVSLVINNNSYRTAPKKAFKTGRRDVGAPNPRLRPPARRIFLQARIEHRFFPFRQIQVGFDHDAAQFFEPHCWFPAEDAAGFF